MKLVRLKSFAFPDKAVERNKKNILDSDHKECYEVEVSNHNSGSDGYLTLLKDLRFKELRTNSDLPIEHETVVKKGTVFPLEIGYNSLAKTCAYLSGTNDHRKNLARVPYEYSFKGEKHFPCMALFFNSDKSLMSDSLFDF